MKLMRKQRRRARLSTLAVLCLLVAGSTTAADLDEYPVRFVIISDRTGDHTPGIYGQVVTEVQRLRPDFVMTVGDLIEGYLSDTTATIEEWQEYLELTEPLTMPIHHTPGNHDIWSNTSEQLYQRFIGDPYYSFDHRDIHFTILDASRYGSSADLPAEQLDWLAADLAGAAAAAHRLVFLHKPFWYEGVAKNRPDTLHQLFVANQVDAVFSGHYHEYFSGAYDGVIYTSIGSSGGGISADPTGLEYHFAWITIDAESVRVNPVKMGSILPWNQVTAENKMAWDRIKHLAIHCENPLPVTEDLRLADSVVTVTVDNTLSPQPLADTLRWHSPVGWSVEPAATYVAVDQGEKLSLEFTAICDSNPFPAPTATLDFAYAEGVTVTAATAVGLSRGAICIKATSPPAIDGQLSESCWQKPITYLLDGDGKRAALETTEFLFAYDATNLYLGAICRESVMDSLVAGVSEADGAVWAEDCLGYFLEPHHGSNVAYQIYFNALGTPFDQKLTLGQDGWMDSDVAWNGDYEVAVTTLEDSWSLEVRVPLDQFEIQAQPGQKWRLNFRRKQQHLKAVGDWQVPLDYNPATYGILKFE